MFEEARIGLSDTALRGRLRAPGGATQGFCYKGQRAPVPFLIDIGKVPTVLHRQSIKTVAQSSKQLIQDTKPHRRSTTTMLPQRPTPKVLPRSIIDIQKPQTVVRPAVTETTPKPLRHPIVHTAAEPTASIPLRAATPTRRFTLGRFTKGWRRYSGSQRVLLAMAACVFVIGLAVSIQTLLTNKATTAQVAALSKKADNANGGNQSSSTPSTTKPSSQAFGQYAVAPDLPRYIKIPKLQVDARVLQVGVTTNGALGTPNNVYDAAWYTGSAKPGQVGATLLDGHVSSWTTHGVFYGIKTLVAGDTIQIVRGDDTVLTYKVVKTQTYADDQVDMQAAITPITAGKSGLNLITCSGKVKPGTSEFDQRVIVFAEQI